MLEAAPSAHSQVLEMFTAADVKLWLSHARQLNLTDPTALKGILFLEQLLAAALIPKETVLLPNYPNPFNPETLDTVSVGTRGRFRDPDHL